MIYKNNYELIDLKHHILNDFPMDNIVKDFEETLPFNPDCTVWIEEGRLLGYMCVIRTPNMVFCGYTKAKEKKIIRTLYKHLQGLYKEAQDDNIPLITNGDNFDHCKNHVIQYKDTSFFEYILT